MKWSVRRIWRLDKPQTVECHPQVSDSLGLGWGQIICISNRFVVDSDTLGPRPHLEKHYINLQSTACLKHMIPQVLSGLWPNPAIPSVCNHFPSDYRPCFPGSAESWLCSPSQRQWRWERRAWGGAIFWAAWLRGAFAQTAEGHLWKVREPCVPAQRVWWNLRDHHTSLLNLKPETSFLLLSFPFSYDVIHFLRRWKQKGKSRVKSF